MGKPTATDYTELRMVAERYVDAVNRFDGEAWGATWAPDGEWHVGGVIEDVTGDTASGRWYLGEFLHFGEGNTSENCICYQDTYTRIDGQWYIQTRQFVGVYQGETGLTGEGFKPEFRGTAPAV